MVMAKNDLPRAGRPHTTERPVLLPHMMLYRQRPIRQSVVDRPIYGRTALSPEYRKKRIIKLELWRHCALLIIFVSVFIKTCRSIERAPETIVCVRIRVHGSRYVRVMGKGKVMVKVRGTEPYPATLDTMYVLLRAVFKGGGGFRDQSPRKFLT